MLVYARTREGPVRASPFILLAISQGFRYHKCDCLAIAYGDRMLSFKIITALALGAVATALATSPSAWAQTAYTLTIRNHQFEPTELQIPADQKVELRVVNADSTPEEFESLPLHREKVIPGGQTVTIYIGPVAAGRYEFFGDFNPKTARGTIVAK
jgi:Cupredoxin-like domain